jgi:hypothetical protein
MEELHIEAVRPLQSLAGAPREPHCAAIITADPLSRSAGLQAALAAMLEEGVALVRVGNPLSAPLSLIRILIQLELVSDGEGSSGDDDVRLGQLLERHRTVQGRVGLIIEQAETLEPAALFALQQLVSGPGSVLVLFVGQPAFWELLEDTHLAPLCSALAIQKPQCAPLPVPDGIEPVMPHPTLSQLIGVGSASTAIPMSGSSISSPGHRRRWWIPGSAGVLIAVAMAAVLAQGGLFYHAAPQRTDAEPPVTDVPLPSVAPIFRHRLSGTATTTVFEEPPAARPQQRAEPPASPAKAGPPLITTPSASVPAAPTETHQTRQWQASPALSPPLGGRVVIHFRERSETGEAAATRLATMAAAVAASVQTRVVSATPSALEIRFFHSEDEARARALADALRSPGPKWEIRNFGTFRPSPSLGTIEVWIPAR